MSKAHSSKGALKDPILDDVRSFANLDKALGNLGISNNERLAIYTTVACVLHLGNIQFEENPEDLKGQNLCHSYNFFFASLNPFSLSLYHSFRS